MKDELPEVVIIFGQRFNVKVCDPGEWSSNGMGRCSVQSGKILLSSKLGEDATLSTLLHECIHAALDITQHKSGESESLIGVLEAFMFSFIRQNPALIAQIMDVE
jgi:hypothetical protein